MKTRDRSKENLGKSGASWQKHDFVSYAANAHSHKLWHGFKKAPGIIIDMTAGDGAGVEQPQLSLFGTNPSHTTAELAVGLAKIFGNVDAILCEKKASRRRLLEKRWPDVIILENHSEAVRQITDRHKWALVLNDPDGPKDHGIEHMIEISNKLPISDFIIVFNKAGWNRVNGYAQKRADTSPGKAMAAYSWMEDPLEWALRLHRKKLAVSKLIRASTGFHYRIMVAANVLTAAIERSRQFEVVK